MNIIDIAILLILFIFIVVGLYQGFTVSILSTASSILSWVLAWLFYPVLAGIFKTNGVYETILNLSDGAQKLSSIDLSKTPIANLDTSQITEAVSNAKLPSPFNSALLSNIQSGALSSQNITTLGDYFNSTIAMVLTNILCFIIIFIVVRIIFSIVIGMTKYVVKLPVLKQTDTLLGGAFGFVRGAIILYLVFMLLPIVMTLFPIDKLQGYIDASFFAKIFYNGNLFLSFIRPIIG